MSPNCHGTHKSRVRLRLLIAHEHKRLSPTEFAIFTSQPWPVSSPRCFCPRIHRPIAERARKGRLSPVPQQGTNQGERNKIKARRHESSLNEVRACLFAATSSENRPLPKSDLQSTRARSVATSAAISISGWLLKLRHDQRAESRELRSRHKTLKQPDTATTVHIVFAESLQRQMARPKHVLNQRQFVRAKGPASGG